MSKTTMSGFPKAIGTKPSIDAEEPEMSMFVKDMLEQMNTKFSTMGDKIMRRMTEMNSRMDELEVSIGELMNQAGLEQTLESPRSQDSSGRAALPNNVSI